LTSLAGGSAVLSLSGPVPKFLAQAAAAESNGKKETILVVVQLTGGNDGLNTVVPFNHDAYRKARPKLAIPVKDVLKINESLGLHPSAKGLSKLLAGKLAIVQGVGYSNPNRSTLNRWISGKHAARQLAPTGWLGDFSMRRPSTDIGAGRHVD
jgi:uncharacterized protein (DUF1501 family)